MSDPQQDVLASLTLIDPALLAPSVDAPPFVTPIESAGGHRRTHRRRPVSAAAATVVALALVGVSFMAFDGHGAASAAPAPILVRSSHPGSSRLLELASVTQASSPTEVSGVGYTRSVSWSWVLSVDGDGTKVQAQMGEDELWVTGSGDTWRTSSRGDLITAGKVEQVDLPSGGPTGTPRRAEGGGVPLQTALPAETAAVRALLGTANPGAPEPYRTFQGATALMSRQPLTPTSRARLFRALSELDGIQSAGTVKDRAGRSGIGFYIDSDYTGATTRYLAVFSPENGELMDLEETMLKGAPKLPIDGPTVVSFQVFIGSRFVTAPGERD
jgi:hypothetical protein